MTVLETAPERPAVRPRKARPFHRGATFTPIGEPAAGSRHTKTRSLSELLPRWGREAADWFLDFVEPSAWSLGMGMAIITLLIGAALVFGNGMFSIRGTWAILDWLRYPVDRTTIPTPIWWAIPAALFFVETIGRHIRVLRLFFYPAVVFDGATTAIYIAQLLLPVVSFKVAVVAAAALGLLIAIGAERALLGSCSMVAVLLRNRNPAR